MKEPAQWWKLQLPSGQGFSQLPLGQGLSCPWQASFTQPYGLL